MGDEVDVEPIEVEINEDIKKSLKKLSLPLELVPESARMQVKQSVRNLNSQIIGEMNGEKVHLVRCEDVFLHIGPNPELVAKSATLGKTGRYALLEISKNYAYCIFSIDIKKSPTIVSIGDYDEKEDLLIHDTQFGANVNIIGIKSDRLFFDLRTAEIIDKCTDSLEIQSIIDEENYDEIFSLSKEEMFCATNQQRIDLIKIIIDKGYKDSWYGNGLHHDFGYKGDLGQIDRIIENNDDRISLANELLRTPPVKETEHGSFWDELVSYDKHVLEKTKEERNYEKDFEEIAKETGYNIFAESEAYFNETIEYYKINNDESYIKKEKRIKKFKELCKESLPYYERLALLKGIYVPYYGHVNPAPKEIQEKEAPILLKKLIPIINKIPEIQAIPTTNEISNIVQENDLKVISKLIIKHCEIYLERLKIARDNLDDEKLETILRLSGLVVATRNTGEFEQPFDQKAIDKMLNDAFWSDMLWELIIGLGSAIFMIAAAVSGVGILALIGFGIGAFGAVKNMYEAIHLLTYTRLDFREENLIASVDEVQSDIAWACVDIAFALLDIGAAYKAFKAGKLLGGPLIEGLEEAIEQGIKEGAEEGIRELSEEGIFQVQKMAAGLDGGKIQVLEDIGKEAIDEIGREVLEKTGKEVLEETGKEVLEEGIVTTVIKQGIKQLDEVSDVITDYRKFYDGAKKGIEVLGTERIVNLATKLKNTGKSAGKYAKNIKIEEHLAKYTPEAIEGLEVIFELQARGLLRPSQVRNAAEIVIAIITRFDDILIQDSIFRTISDIKKAAGWVPGLNDVLIDLSSPSAKKIGGTLLILRYFIKKFKGRKIIAEFEKFQSWGGLVRRYDLVTILEGGKKICYEMKDWTRMWGLENQFAKDIVIQIKDQGTIKNLRWVFGDEFLLVFRRKVLVRMASVFGSDYKTRHVLLKGLTEIEYGIARKEFVSSTKEIVIRIGDL